MYCLNEGSCEKSERYLKSAVVQLTIVISPLVLLASKLHLRIQVETMPFKPPERAMCPKCNKAVYAAEERLAGGYKWHKGCFKCNMCNKMLDSTNAAEHAAALYCKNCHGRKFGPKGYGFGGGAGALSMDTGEQFGNKDAEMSNRPTQAVQGSGSAKTGPGPHCPRCGRTVYDAERAIGSATPWHKSCFNCNKCHKAIDSTTMNEYEGELYCKNCYVKDFGPVGIL